MADRGDRSGGENRPSLIPRRRCRSIFPKIWWRTATPTTAFTTPCRELVGSYAGALDFFSDGLLLCKSPASGLYSYVRQDGTAAFEGEYSDAGVFLNGRALVRTTDGAYLAIDTQGQTLYTLEHHITPSYMTIFGRIRLRFPTGPIRRCILWKAAAISRIFLYNTISEFHGGVAMVRQANRWPGG